MNFIDLFAGLGGFRLGMEEAGHKCVGFCEIDKFARITYKANFDTDGEWEAYDITSVTDDDIRELGRTRTIDIICGGFPCQAFSIAGKRRGFDDTRGTLFFEIARFARILKPKYLFLENVKGLLNHEQGRTFEVILQTLDELGYDAEWQLLNSKNFGVPQNRERVYIIGHLRGTSGRKIFPIGRTNSQTIRQIIGGSQAERVYDVGGLSVTLSSQGGGGGAKTGLYLMDLSKTNPKITDIARTLQARYNKGIANRQAEVSGVLCLGNINPSGRGMNGQVFDSRGLSPTITTNKGEGNKIAIPVLTPERIEKRQNGRRFKTNGEPMFTLTGQDRHGVAILQKPRGNNRGGVHEVAPTVSSHSYQENNHLIDRNMRIRKLTPLECFRLQSYPDIHWKRAKEVGVSDSQLYKQAGNGVTKNVVYEIARILNLSNSTGLE